MNFIFFHKQINKIIEENHKNPVNIEINYNELKYISIKIFNIYFNNLKKYEKNFNIYVIKKLYNESDFNLKFNLIFHLPDFYTIILNDFIKFIFEIVQKTKQNICSKVYNSCFNDGDKIERLPEYKYHYYLNHNKESCVLIWYNEYIQILNKHLNNILNNELYIRQTNIIIKLAEIKAKLKQKKDMEYNIKNSNDNLENSNDNLENSNDNIKNSNDNLENSNDNLENSNDNLKNSNEDIKNSNDNLENSNDNLENSNDNLKNSNDNLKNSNDNLKNSNEDIKNSIYYSFE